MTRRSDGLAAYHVGQTFPTLIKEPITLIQMVRYAGASGDFNPIHTVPDAGRSAGFEGPIAHGMLVMASAAQAVTGWVAQRYLRRLAVRFVNVTRPGDVLHISGSVVGGRFEGDFRHIEGEVTVQNQAGEVKVRGTFAAVIPGTDGR